MTNQFKDTIVAPATLPGTGAISIIRLSGPECFAIVDKVVQLGSGSISQCAGYTIKKGEIPGLDEVLVSVFRAPHSYTGEDSVEISCHASRYIVSEAIGKLLTAGCRMAGPGEFTQRAFLNGKMDLTQAEAVADIISSTTEASHRIAYKQLRGGFSQKLQELRAELMEMTSLLELELDFSEEDVEFADRSRLIGLVDATASHINSLTDSFRLGNAIRNGIPVAIVGAANAGKSTLLNALLEEDRAIVSPIAGTTRDSVEETVNIGGYLFRFIDTAGIRETSETIEQCGIERTFKRLSEADIVIAVLDLENEESDLLEILGTLLPRLDKSAQYLVLAFNKSDKCPEERVNKNVRIINNFVISAGLKAIDIILSAKNNQGVVELKEALLGIVRQLLPAEDSTFLTNIRHYEALQEAASSLVSARRALVSGIPSDLVAEDLRLAIAALNRLLGRDLIDPESVLHNIFSKHCIGK